jgi:hypothetical protein
MRVLQRDVELALKRELDGIDGVDTEVVGEPGGQRDGLGRYAEAFREECEGSVCYGCLKTPVS